MREEIAREVYNELEANGYDPKLHEPKERGGLFEISVPGASFGLGDFRTMAKISEDFGVGLKLEDDSRLTLR